MGIKILSRSPMEGAGIVLVLLILYVLATMSASTASKLCPAALSATVNTGSSMLFGYVAQTILFDDAPKLLTMCGAILMFSAIVIMAVARSTGRKIAAADTRYAVGEEHPADVSVEDDQSEIESLGSFIATEFVAFASQPTELEVLPRQRRVVTRTLPAAQQIGCLVSVCPAA